MKVKAKFKDVFGEYVTEDLEDFIIRRLKHGSGGMSRGRIEDLQDEVDRLRRVLAKLICSMIEDFEPEEKDLQYLMDCGPFELVNEEEDSCSHNEE